MKRTERTSMSRLAKRAVYEDEQIYSILDEAMYCTLAYCQEGQPFQIPTGFVRMDDKIFIHGSVGSHFMRALATGIPVCISVTLTDALVLARSALHHSMNYRSVVLFSQAELVEQDEEKNKMFEAFTEKLLPGRWAEVRKPYKKETDRTMVLSFKLDEASAKVRAHGAVDEEEDMQWPVWAGVLSTAKGYHQAIQDEQQSGVEAPAYLKPYLL